MWGYVSLLAYYMFVQLLNVKLLSISVYDLFLKCECVTVNANGPHISHLITFPGIILNQRTCVSVQNVTSVHIATGECSLCIRGLLCYLYTEHETQYAPSMCQSIRILNMWDLRFLQQCCCRFKSHGMWCVTRCVIPAILKNHIAFIVRVKQPEKRFFFLTTWTWILGHYVPETLLGQHNISEDLNICNVKYNWCLK